jgi:hypothetical protein
MAKAKKPVAKHAKVKRMPKSNKRMKHHFDDGGDIDTSMSSVADNEPVGGGVGVEAPNYDNLSFGKAYALARKVGDPTFKWRKGTYSSELGFAPGQSPAGKKLTANAIPEITTTATRANPLPQSLPRLSPGIGQQLPSSDDQLASTSRLLQAAKDAQSPTAQGLKANSGDLHRGYLGEMLYKLTHHVPLKKGGKVKKAEKVAKYAKGGHIKSKRGDGLATKGKTKGRVC